MGRGRKGKGGHARDLMQGEKKEGKKSSSKTIAEVSSQKTNSKYLYWQYDMKHKAEINYINCQAQSTDLLYLNILNVKQMGKQAQKFCLVLQEDK